MSREFPAFFQAVQKELELVFEKLEVVLQPQAKLVLQKFLPHFDLDRVIPPGLVLLGAHLFAKTGTAILPAVFVELIYLATTLHNLPWKRGKESPTLILGGDYLFGHLFFLLCEHNCLFLLDRLARLIKEMSEGSTLLETGWQKGRELNRQSILEGLKKQYGSFFGESCALGCLFAGGDEEKQFLISKFGVEIGIAYGAKRIGLESSLSLFHLNRALCLLASFPAPSGKKELEKAAREIALLPPVKITSYPALI
ncbi:MAG: polyprenyl synthetase family protein [Bacillota bacterium]|nr:polyprenyl synthetase family protein [Bacillota bacterium]